MQRLSSAIVLVAVGFLVASGSPARAQYGDMGDTLKKGAGGAVKGAAEGAGLTATAAPPTEPVAGTGAPTPPAGAADVPPAAPGADNGAPAAVDGD